MKLFLLVAFLAVVACHPTDRVRQLLAELKDTDTDTLRQETEELIKTTETEMTLLRNLVVQSIDQSSSKITDNLKVLLDYSTKRSSELVSYLSENVQTQSKDYSEEDSTTCLSLMDVLSSLPTAFEERIKLTLITATRLGNATVRNDVNLMDNKFQLLDNLSQALDACGDDYECVVEVSNEAVEYNVEFINSYNDILINIVQVPQQIANQAKADAETTVFSNEDYACNTAKIMTTCFSTYDKIQPVGDDDDTTTYLPSTTDEPSPSPDTHCSHEPFNPNA